jgi:hypothetical protein
MTAAKIRSHSFIQALFKRINVVLIVREPYVGNAFSVPELTL